MRGPLRLPVAEACAEGPEKETGIGDQNFLGGLGRVIVQHTEVNRVGPRTQCLGQKQPGRNKRKLLTRASRKRRGGLGSEELLT